MTKSSCGVHRLFKHKLAILLMLFFLTGCQSHLPQNIPIVDRNSPNAVMHGRHVVKKGETMYAIAWRYGRDFRELNAINAIKAPYTIFPGQIIKLDRLRAKKRKPITHKTKSHAKSTKYKQLLRDKPTSKALLPKHWMWPVKGQVISRFNHNSLKNKGINISAPYGDPVKATATGKVVYSGSGLRGYGQLIIIKHSDEYLSAYAHNSKLLVREGELVKVGQKIAEIGRSDAKRALLHFEIRKNGKPVNPLVYLSKRTAF